jgi:hypothetical protein
MHFVSIASESLCQGLRWQILRYAFIAILAIPASGPNHDLFNKFHVFQSNVIKQPKRYNGTTCFGYRSSKTYFCFVLVLYHYVNIGCPTSSVAQANLTIKINFNILRSFSSSDIFTIYLHAFLQSLHPFEKSCVQGFPRDFRQNTRIRPRSSDGVSAQYPISFLLREPKRKKSEGAKSRE